MGLVIIVVFFFQAEDGIRDLVRSRGLGDVYKRQVQNATAYDVLKTQIASGDMLDIVGPVGIRGLASFCLLYTSDAADERSSVDLGGRRIIKKKTQITRRRAQLTQRDI